LEKVVGDKSGRGSRAITIGFAIVEAKLSTRTRVRKAPVEKHYAQNSVSSFIYSDKDVPVKPSSRML